MSRKDRELLSRVAEGDGAAFGDLYDRFAPRAYGLIRAIVGTRQGADEVLQETFWSVWNAASEYDERRSSLPVWICVIARSRAIDYLRRQARRADPKRGAGDAVVLADPRDRMEDVESTLRTRSAFAQLPPDQQDAIELAYLRGLTHGQIASLKSVPLGTDKTRIRLGIEKMRDVIQHQHEGASP